MRYKLAVALVIFLGSLSAAALPATRRVNPASRPATAKAAASKTTVFILETRGSMLPIFNEIQEELGRAINQLPSDEAFNLIWFEEENSKVLAPAPVLATELNKKLAYAAVLEASARGAHDGKGLALAINKAHAMKADSVWLISIGFPDKMDCDRATAALGKAQTTNMKINTTVRYVPHGDEASRTFLLNLAEQTHGVSIDRNGEIVRSANTPDPSTPVAPLPATLPSGPSIFRDK